MQAGPGPIVSDCQPDLLFAMSGESCDSQMKCVWSTASQDVAGQRTTKEGLAAVFHLGQLLLRSFVHDHLLSILFEPDAALNIQWDYPSILFHAGSTLTESSFFYFLECIRVLLPSVFKGSVPFI